MTPRTDPSSSETPIGPTESSGESAAVPRRVWSATALLAGGRVWGSLVSALILIVLARTLSLESFGRFTFYLALFALVDGWTDFGTGAVAVQRGARGKDQLAAALPPARALRTIFATVGFGSVAAGAFLFDEPGAAWIALAALYPFTRSLELSSVVFQTAIDWRTPVLTRAAGATLRLVASLALCQVGTTMAAPFLLVHAGGLAAGNWLVHRAARGRLAQLPRTTATTSRRTILRLAAPLGLATLCQQAYFSIDNLFVRAIAGDVELGRYNAGVRLMSFAILFAAYSTTAALPWLSRRHERGDLGRAATRLGQPLFAAAALLGGIVWPWRAEILELIFGSSFTSAAPALGWLIVAATLVYAGAPLLTALVAAGATRTVFAITATALLINIAGNAWLVPNRGIEGAAIATLVTEGAIAALAWLALCRMGTRLPRPLLWAVGPTLFVLGAAGSGALR